MWARPRKLRGKRIPWCHLFWVLSHSYWVLWLLRGRRAWRGVKEEKASSFPTLLTARRIKTCETKIFMQLKRGFWQNSFICLPCGGGSDPTSSTLSSSRLKLSFSLELRLSLSLSSISTHDRGYMSPQPETSSIGSVGSSSVSSTDVQKEHRKQLLKLHLT